MNQGVLAAALIIVIAIIIGWMTLNRKKMYGE